MDFRLNGSRADILADRKVSQIQKEFDPDNVFTPL